MQTISEKTFPVPHLELHIQLYCVEIDVTNKRIYWQEFDIGDKITVKSDGVPFIMMGRKVYDCHFGRDRNVKLKEKLRLQREEILKVENLHIIPYTIL